MGYLEYHGIVLLCHKHSTWSIDKIYFGIIAVSYMTNLYNIRTNVLMYGDTVVNMDMKNSIHNVYHKKCTHGFVVRFEFLLPLSPPGFTGFINPHPVMSSDLLGPPAGPRRPGTMIFKCVEFLVQSKYRNSSYWLSHIATALNCKICSISSKYPVSCEEYD